MPGMSRVRVSKNATKLSYHFEDGFLKIGHLLGGCKSLTVFQSSSKFGSDRLCFLKNVSVGVDTENKLMVTKWERG